MSQITADVRVGDSGKRQTQIVVANDYDNLLKRIYALYGDKAVIINIRLS